MSACAHLRHQTRAAAGARAEVAPWSADQSATDDGVVGSGPAHVRTRSRAAAIEAGFVLRLPKAGQEGPCHLVACAPGPADHLQVAYDTQGAVGDRPRVQRSVADPWRLETRRGRPTVSSLAGGGWRQTLHCGQGGSTGCSRLVAATWRRSFQRPLFSGGDVATGYTQWQCLSPAASCRPSGNPLEL
jgi:hypothetical protein